MLCYPATNDPSAYNAGEPVIGKVTPGNKDKTFMQISPLPPSGRNDNTSGRLKRQDESSPRTIISCIFVEVVPNAGPPGTLSLHFCAGWTFCRSTSHGFPGSSLEVVQKTFPPRTLFCNYIINEACCFRQITNPCTPAVTDMSLNAVESRSSTAGVLRNVLPANCESL